MQLQSGAIITRKQFLFIERFFECEFDFAKAVVAAGYRTDNPLAKGEELMANPMIASEIIRRMKNIRESAKIGLQDIIEQLWDEANNNAAENQSARVNALSHLARIFGGFERGRNEEKPVVAINMDFSLEDDE